jgi:AraC-like DNA-binding protein
LSELTLAPGSSALRRILPPGAQRVGQLVEAPALLRELGADPATVLRRAGLAPTDLADPERRLPYASITALLGEGARATGCGHFGLLLGARWRLEHMGLPGELAANCATVGRALETFTVLHWLNASGGVAYLGRDDGVTTLGYAVYEPGLADGLQQVCDCVLAVGVAMLRQLGGNAGWAPSLVRLSRVRPPDPRPYQQLFRAPLEFDAEVSALDFPTTFEHCRVPGADETRRRALEAALHALPREALIQRLYRLIRVAMVFGLTSGDAVAAAMGLTRRTLIRRLGEHGTTFQAALATVRYEVARQLLRDTAMPVSQIALSLGYAELAPFVRAFRRWSGRSPASWRATGSAPESLTPRQPGSGPP